MGESGSCKFDHLRDRLREAIGDREGDVHVDAIATRLRETVGKAGSDVDVNALIGRARDAVGSVEDRVNAEKIRQWIDDLDRDKLEGWLEEARSATGSAATFLEEQGDRLSDRAPGAFDKVVGVAKEAAGDFFKNDELAREGELQHLKGAIESRFADAADSAEIRLVDAVDEVTAKPNQGAD